MSKVGDTFAEFGKKMFDSECKPLERLYVDLEYIQDLKFGTLLNLSTVPAEFSYIIGKVPEYNRRLDNHTGNHFKAMHADDEKLLETLRNPQYTDAICVTTPFTSIYYYLNLVVSMAVGHSRAYSEHPKKMTIVVNCADVDYPKFLQKRLCGMLSEQLDVDVEFQQTKRYSLSSGEYLSYDMLFLYDIAEFIKQHATEFVSNGKFIDKKIVANPYVEDGILEKADDPMSLIRQTERNLDIYCDFFFLKSEIVLESLRKE